MTTYNTYQEAKISNPESNIYIQAGEFLPEKSIRPSPWTYDFRGLALCNPADYCMTVEKFLADGNKFVEGDFILDEGSVYLVTDCKTQNYWYETESANEPDCDDNRRHVLHAAALELKPADKVAKALGRPLTPSDFGVALAEKPKRVKVSYVMFHPTPGDSVYLSHKNKNIKQRDVMYLFVGRSLDDKGVFQHKASKNIFEESLSLVRRKQETEINERQEFIDEACGTLDDDESVNHYSRYFGQLYDSGKFKLVN